MEKTDCVQVTCLDNLKFRDVPCLVNPPFSPTAYSMETFRNILSFLDFCTDFWNVNCCGCDERTALCHSFPSTFWFLWKLGLLLRARKLTSLQSKLEARIFSQGGKTELFCQNRKVLKTQLNLRSLQIAFGFLQLARALKSRFFSEKIITVYVGNHSNFLTTFFSKHFFKTWKILPNSPCVMHNVVYARFNKASTLNELYHRALMWLLLLIDIVPFQ